MHPSQDHTIHGTDLSPSITPHHGTPNQSLWSRPSPNIQKRRFGKSFLSSPSDSRKARSRSTTLLIPIPRRWIPSQCHTLITSHTLTLTHTTSHTRILSTSHILSLSLLTTHTHSSMCPISKRICTSTSVTTRSHTDLKTTSTTSLRHSLEMVSADSSWTGSML